MKSQLTVFLFLFLSLNGIAQEITYKKYSYTEFFKMIEEETDSVFQLENAFIKYNKATDKHFRENNSKDYAIDTLQRMVVDKALNLNNVQFLGETESINGVRFYNGILINIHFKKDVFLENSISLNIDYCRFDGVFRQFISDCSTKIASNIDPNSFMSIENSRFQVFYFSKLCGVNNPLLLNLAIRNNTIKNTLEISEKLPFNLYARDLGFLTFEDNTIETDLISIWHSKNSANFNFKNNQLVSEDISFRFYEVDGIVNVSNNKFSSDVKVRFDKLKSVDSFVWSQLKGELLSATAIEDYIRDIYSTSPIGLSFQEQKTFMRNYKDSIRFFDKDVFAKEVSLKGQFYKFYRENYNIETANEVYVNLKDFETQRMKVLYLQKPSFSSFFTWKINQFLKVFSAYGTEPARAIIYSMYVILIFALVYLFFPNSWDRHGKNRILNRYRFFLKYMNKQAGIHEVYLADQEEELMGYDEYRKLIESSDKKVPKFFTSTALPIYKWSISGTKLSATFLSKIDIMKGTWSELPQHKRFWKSVLLVGAFLVSIMYDIFIKVLNALMLSINTFTTLGFGEIPIKGLPRYLAIIQGFIGWFMLTIFSVSLISQLLN